MKTLLLFLVTSLALVGCGNKGGSSAACGDAINKGVDSMMAASAKRMEAMNAPPEMKTKLGEAAVKLKEVITKRCVEDKWSKEVIDCYAAATSQRDLSGCRAKLPTDQGDKLKGEEIAVMSSMMGGMRPGMMHGGSGMGGPGMGGPGMGGPGMAGSATTPSGSGTTPSAPAPVPAGSAAK